MTNGGLDTTRSNRRPATGAKKSPVSSSHSWLFRAAVSAASRSARGFTSVPVTLPACRARCSACTPQPTPRSSAAPTGRRTVACASVTDAPPTPSTWSLRSGPGRTSAPRSETTHQSVSPSPYGRRSSPARRAPPPAGTSSPAASAASTGSGANALRTSGSGQSTPIRNSRIRVDSGVPSTVARSAGTRSPRASAECVTGPSSACTESTS